MPQIVKFEHQTTTTELMTTSPEADPKPQLVRGIGLGSATALNMIDMIGVGPVSITIRLSISAMGGPQAACWDGCWARCWRSAMAWSGA